MLVSAITPTEPYGLSWYALAMKWFFLIGFAIAIPNTAIAGNQWEELMGPGKGNVWTDPQGRFSINLPVNWKHQKTDSEQIVRFGKHNKDRGHSAVLTVEMRALPPGVKLSHFALRIESELKKAARNLRKGQAKRIVVTGHKARRTEYTYQERGHALRTNYANQVVLIDGERGWILTFLSAYGAQGIFMEELDKLIASFNPGQTNRPIRPGKKRKKLRAGEMVNPELLKY